jgi:hypothetical protein
MFEKAMLADMILTQKFDLMNLFLDGGQGRTNLLNYYAAFVWTLMDDAGVPTALTRVVSAHSHYLVMAGRVM